MCMLHDHQHDSSQHNPSTEQSATRWYTTPLGLLCLGLAPAMGYYLWAYHTQHVLAFLPFVLFLACPLMHLLGHKHHSDHA